MTTPSHPGELGVPPPAAPRPSVTTIIYCWLGAIAAAVVVGVVLSLKGRYTAAELAMAAIITVASLPVIVILKRRQRRLDPPPGAPDTTTPS